MGREKESSQELRAGQSTQIWGSEEEGERQVEEDKGGTNIRDSFVYPMAHPHIMSWVLGLGSQPHFWRSLRDSPVRLDSTLSVFWPEK